MNKTVFDSVKKTWDISILTETKFKADQLKGLKQEWDGMSVHSVAPTTNARSGVSILFKRGLAFKPLSFFLVKMTVSTYSLCNYRL